jgi:hypothetical protein
LIYLFLLTVPHGMHVGILYINVIIFEETNLRSTYLTTYTFRSYQLVVKTLLTIILNKTQSTLLREKCKTNTLNMLGKSIKKLREIVLTYQH